MNEWINKWINERMNEWNEWINEWNDLPCNALTCFSTMSTSNFIDDAIAIILSWVKTSFQALTNIKYPYKQILKST